MEQESKESGDFGGEKEAAQSGKIETRQQVSAGGVAFRQGREGLEVAVVRVPPRGRWQLPKGLVGRDETPEETAVREVREEAGVDTELLAPIEIIEYWYVAHGRGRRVRFHKFVHFFLLAYRAGDVADHDHEVEEARWVSIDQAVGMLAFKSEKDVVEKAWGLIADL